MITCPAPELILEPSGVRDLPPFFASPIDIWNLGTLVSLLVINFPIDPSCHLVHKSITLSSLMLQKITDLALGTSGVVGNGESDPLKKLIASRNRLGEFPLHIQAQPPIAGTNLPPIEKVTLLDLHLESQPTNSTEGDNNEIKALYNLLEKMMDYDSTTRISAQAALEHEFFVGPTTTDIIGNFSSLSLLSKGKAKE